MDYKIRFATPDDHDLIYALKTASVRPYVEKIWGWDEDYQRNDFDSDFAAIKQFNVIEVDGRFVGFVQYYCKSLYYEVVEIHLEHDRVIGSIGYNSIPGTTEVKLHRLYVKAALKRQGIGTRLLRAAERHLQEEGKTAAHVHLGGKEYFESRSFYPKHGYREYAPSMMKKEL